MSEEVKNKSEYLVEVRDLKQYFPIKTGFMKTTPLKAVDGVSSTAEPGFPGRSMIVAPEILVRGLSVAGD